MAELVATNVIEKVSGAWNIPSHNQNQQAVSNARALEGNIQWTSGQQVNIPREVTSARR
jgi:hypothetical protein